LAKLKFLEVFLDSYEYDFYTPESVVNEIQTKDDEASQYLLLTIQQKKLKVRATNLTSLVISLNARLGIGEAEAIALGTELQANYIILVIFPPEKQL
jgi:predicted nucleic acid-binding protein